jgi:hypothetical protein
MFQHESYIEQALSFDWLSFELLLAILGFLLVNFIGKQVGREIEPALSKLDQNQKKTDSERFLAQAIVSYGSAIILFLCYITFFLGVIAWNSF